MNPESPSDCPERLAKVSMSARLKDGFLSPNWNCLPSLRMEAPVRRMGKAVLVGFNLLALTAVNSAGMRTTFPSSHASLTTLGNSRPVERRFMNKSVLKDEEAVHAPFALCLWTLSGN